MPILYRLYSTQPPRAHYFGVCPGLTNSPAAEDEPSPATTKAALHAEFERLCQAYALYANGIPRMIGGEPHREPWEASFAVLKKLGKEMVLIEALREWPGASPAFMEGVLKCRIQNAVDLPWQKKESDSSQCVNVVYRVWPHSQGLNSDLLVPAGREYIH